MNLIYSAVIRNGFSEEGTDKLRPKVEGHLNWNLDKDLINSTADISKSVLAVDGTWAAGLRWACLLVNPNLQERKRGDASWEAVARV